MPQQFSQLQESQMIITGVNASQPRKNADESAYGAINVVQQLSQLIDASRKDGQNSITQTLNRKNISDTALKGATSILEDRGYNVERLTTTPVHVTVKITWQQTKG
jgi:hypothetical protein